MCRRIVRYCLKEDIIGRDYGETEHRGACREELSLQLSCKINVYILTKDISQGIIKLVHAVVAE